MEQKEQSRIRKNSKRTDLEAFVFEKCCISWTFSGNIPVLRMDRIMFGQ